jgi:hypothetical protein
LKGTWISFMEKYQICLILKKLSCALIAIVQKYWLIDWLFTVLRPAQDFFTYMETLPLPVKGCKIWAYARRSRPLSREGSLSRHTCCDTGPRFFRSHPKDRPNQSPLTTHKRMWRIYSNPNPHGARNTDNNKLIY